MYKKKKRIHPGCLTPKHFASWFLSEEFKTHVSKNVLLQYIRRKQPRLVLSKRKNDKVTADPNHINI